MRVLTWQNLERLHAGLGQMDWRTLCCLKACLHVTSSVMHNAIKAVAKPLQAKTKATKQSIATAMTNQEDLAHLQILYAEWASCLLTASAGSGC